MNWHIWVIFGFCIFAWFSSPTIYSINEYVKTLMQDDMFDPSFYLQAESVRHFKDYMIVISIPSQTNLVLHNVCKHDTMKVVSITQHGIFVIDIVYVKYCCEILSKHLYLYILHIQIQCELDSKLIASVLNTIICPIQILQTLIVTKNLKYHLIGIHNHMFATFFSKRIFGISSS